jgi:2-amino-4-hydroxy-6-hydroxymethyldihydropteridine diphosphokinase
MPVDEAYIGIGANLGAPRAHTLPMPVDEAYIGIGANLGDPRAQVERAFVLLAGLPAVVGVRRSSLYATRPAGPVQDQPWFTNACAALAFAAAPAPPALLAALLAVEAACGRDRSRELRLGPRPLDLDLLVWGGRVVGEPGLVLPHPRLGARAFALVPLVELAGPDLLIPGPAGGRAGDLLARALADPEQSVRKLV